MSNNNISPLVTLYM